MLLETALLTHKAEYVPLTCSVKGIQSSAFTSSYKETEPCGETGDTCIS